MTQLKEFEVVAKETEIGFQSAAGFQEISQLVFALMECHKKYGVRDAFSFHSDNARARAFQVTADNILAATGTSSLELNRVDGYMAPKLRRKILQERDIADLRVVANALVLTTGIDVPSVDMVLFADAKRSHVSILQAMGRASRAAEGKSTGLKWWCQSGTTTSRRPNPRLGAAL